ncbi:hypothetical protein RB597_009726 [Gaeumannomyces tritici]
MSADPEHAPQAVSVASAPSTAVFVPMDEDLPPKESVEDMSPTSAPPSVEPVADKDDDSSHEDNDDLDNLTPPPDSPSPVPTIPTASNNLQDEIVVGTKANGAKASPVPIASDPEDAEMEDVEEQPLSSHYPKRKRNSLYSSLNEDSKDLDMSPTVVSEDPIMHASKRTHGTNQVRGVTLGYWRESQVPDKADKHAVIGFIDVRDRLRTRVQQVSRTGKLVIDRYPLPPGPGGSWVTFERIVFEEHLVYLDHDQVKEYVKVRVETFGTEKTEEEAQKNNADAVKEAMARVSAKPAPETGLAPAIAYGESIPEQVKQNSLHEKKKRRLNASFAGAAQSPPTIVPGPLEGQDGAVPGPRIVSRAPRASIVDDLPGTRPTRILVGYWSNSSAEDALDKHAVIGVLGTNDMFRVKLTRQTRDGRAVFGNFPQGPGALWISYEDVVFEPHLRDLSRSEVKEYCRVRQHQLDRLGGKDEAPEERIANETKAVYDAQLRVAAGPNPQSGSGSMAAVTEAVVMAHREKLRTEEADHERRAEQQRIEAQERAAREVVSDDNYDDDGGPNFSPETSFNGHDLRQARRGAAALKEATRPARHSLPNSSDLRAAHRPSNSGPGDSSDRLERVDSIARQSIARAEAHQSRIDQRNNRAGSLSREGKAAAFSDNMKTLNRVWQSQESHRMRSGSSSAAGGAADDAKTYGGVKYERKQNGPFAGKLVSQGTIISIDGEDYVEYRVLTKPSFF